MSRILVTGGCGFIGSHVVAELVNLGHAVMIIDDLSTGKTENLSSDIFQSVKFIKYNLVFGMWPDEIYEFNPDIFIHLAAQPSLLDSEKFPVHDADINIICTLRMIQLAKAVGARRFVFASTSAVESGWSPCFADTGQAIPDSCYGISKLCAEMYLQHLGRSVIILRLANVYGPRQVPLGENQLVPRALNHVYKDAPFEVHHEGKPTRDFVYVKDVSSAFVLAATHRYDRGGVFNVSSGESHSVNDVLKILKGLTAFKKKWPKDEHSWRREQRMHVEMDNNLFVNEFGWQPQYSLEEGLKETVEWYKR